MISVKIETPSKPSSGSYVVNNPLPSLRVPRLRASHARYPSTIHLPLYHIAPLPSPGPSKLTPDLRMMQKLMCCGTHMSSARPPFTHSADEAMSVYRKPRSQRKACPRHPYPSCWSRSIKADSSLAQALNVLDQSSSADDGVFTMSRRRWYETDACGVTHKVRTVAVHSLSVRPRCVDSRTLVSGNTRAIFEIMEVRRFSSVEARN
jgi:hypothetical protein